MPNTFMLSEILKNSTHEVHLALEKQLISRIKTISQTHQYSELLVMMYGYYQPVEQQILKQLTAEDISDIADRRKANFILDDLYNLGHPTANLAINDRLPSISDKVSAFGAAYVLEGSTLGGKIIADLLIRQTSGAVSQSLKFFQGYRESSMNKWLTFKNSLNQITEERDQQSALQSAVETFQTFNYWIRDYDTVKL